MKHALSSLKSSFRITPYGVLLAVLLTAHTLIGLFILFGSRGTEEAWPRHVIYNQGPGADGVDIADIDEDGDLDIVSAWEASGRILLHINPAIGATSQWFALDLGHGMSVADVEDVAFADLDSDGKIDAVVSAMEGQRRTASLHWLVDRRHPNKTDAWRGRLISSAPSAQFLAVRAGQIDGYGMHDVILGARNFDDGRGGIWWLRGAQDLTSLSDHIWQASLIGTAEKVRSMEIIDLDADGDEDVVFADRKIVGWFENPGSGRVRTPWMLHEIDRWAKDVQICDVDQDGTPDLVTTVGRNKAAPNVLAYWYRRLDPVGKTWDRHEILVDMRQVRLPLLEYALKGVACGDIDADGDLDLIFSASGLGTGVFWIMYAGEVPHDDVAWSLYPISSQFRFKFDAPKLADVDLDGDLDLVLSEEHAGLWQGLGVVWYENTVVINAQ